ncbi:hypothetical protein M2406_002171 [Serratia sp. BIGb0163]|nr:hypothetical protein [Serratia sp. BIGb0163]
MPKVTGFQRQVFEGDIAVINMGCNQRAVRLTGCLPCQGREYG